MISNIQQVSSAICFEELFSAAIDHQLSPIEFRVYCQILHNSNPQKVGGLCTQTVLALSTKTKIEINQVEIALQTLINSQLIIRHELSGIKRISYELTEPERWIASTPVMPVSEIKTDRFFGENYRPNHRHQRHPVFIFSPETPWLERPRNSLDINFNPEFIKFQAQKLLEDPKYRGRTIWDAQQIIMGHYVKNPEALILAWNAYQSLLESEKNKALEVRQVFDPSKLTLEEHKAFIAQKKELGDEGFALTGKEQAIYLDWLRKNPAHFNHFVKEINRNK